MKRTIVKCIQQFSTVPTELDHAFESAADGLQELAVGIADIGSSALDLFEGEGNSPIKSVASRLVYQSSAVDKLKEVIAKVNAELDKVKLYVENGKLMYLKTYLVSCSNVNAASTFIETSINNAAFLVDEGSPYKEAYYNMTQVIIEYVGLVRRFNDCVSSYRKLHNITDASFKDANTSLSFFRLKPDVSNLPPVTQAPSNSDVSRGYKK